jgi:hypothetical protein
MPVYLYRLSFHASHVERVDTGVEGDVHGSCEFDKMTFLPPTPPPKQFVSKILAHIPPPLCQTFFNKAHQLFGFKRKASGGHSAPSALVFPDGLLELQLKDRMLSN